ncbi:MAG: aldo/keto reductase [Oscillospiraceae bacterium]|nr:aldo/keto reductase [Oscillospiraceae bacterium]
MIFEETYTLANGVKIPKLGLGTWLIDNAQTAQAVRNATAIGCRHIDTAQAYGNEAGVGEGMQSCGVPREQLFITTKIAAEAKSYQSAAASLDESLRKLGSDYIDLAIIHSPQPWAKVNQSSNRYFAENKEVWRALEDAYLAGKLRAIGVSNFLQQDLENLLSDCRIAPMADQILVHISNTPLKLISFCQSNHIQVEAYSPIAHSEALKNQKIAEIAEKYQVTVPQLCIRYDLQLGLAALPKTANAAHMRENAQVEFTIRAEDMERLKKMEHIKDYGDSSFFPVYGGKLS